MRAVLITSFALLLVLSFDTDANGEVSVSGYFEPQFVGAILDGQFLQLNSNKLRIDLRSYLSEDIMFTGNFNYINYNGAEGWNLLDFLPEQLTAVIPEDAAALYALEYEDEGELDNAYLRLYTSVFTLTLGRQQMSVGPAYAWNPTDLFNIKDLLDPTYEQPGVNGVRLDIGLSDDKTVVVFYSPEETWKESGKLLRLLGRVAHFDYALSAGQAQQRYTDFATLQAGARRKDMLGFDFNGELLGIGCWTENAYGSIEDSGHYWENVVGLDYTFLSGWYAMAEYYHNDQGRGGSERYSFNDWMRYLTGETKALSRNQLYSYTYYPLTDLVTVGGAIVYSASDNSLRLIPTCTYSVSNEVVLTFFGDIYTGAEGTVYSKDMGSGAVIRLRAYF